MSCHIKASAAVAVNHIPSSPPHLGDDASALISELVAGDSRFLFLSSPAEKGSYNYAGDEPLGQLIKEGARGAYWDIFRRNQRG